MKPTQLVFEQLDTREQCRTDKSFLAQQLGYDFQESVHSDLFANYLQIKPDVTLFEQSDVKDRMVLWSRGTYKTTSIVVEIVQLILNFPDIRILLMQDTVKNAQKLLAEIKGHFDGTHHKSKLSEIFPEFCQTEKKLGTKDSFTTPARQNQKIQATVTVASPKASKTGQHYDAGFFDDLVTAENYDNPEQIQQTIKDFSLYVPLIDPGGYRYVTGTRYTFGDLYEHIIRQDAESHSWQISIRGCWTVNEDGSKKLLFPQVKLDDGRLVGHTLDFLEKKQVEDPQMFSAQYMNQPIVAGTQLFTDDLLLGHVRTKLEEGFPSLGHAVLFVDLATSQHGDSDDAVVMTGQADCNNNVFITDGIGGRWGIVGLADVVIAQALLHKPAKILIEKTAAGTAFVEYLRVIAKNQGLNLPLDFIKVSNDSGAKHIRISAVSGFLKQNKLFFLAGLPCWKKMFDQFTKYTKASKARHDDYIDCVGLVAQHFAVNGSTTPVVLNIAHYLMQQPAVPEFVKEPEHESSLGGSMGSDF